MCREFLFKILHSVAFLIKNYVKSLKRGYPNPTEYADSTKNHHKIIGTTNQSIRMKIFPKKSVKVYRSQKFVRLSNGIRPGILKKNKTITLKREMSSGIY
jgi:transposase